MIAGMRSSRPLGVVVLLAVSAALFVAGIFLPIVTINQMVFWNNTFSVLTGIQALWKDGQPALAAIVFLFSVIFPLTKLALMFAVWLEKPGDRRRVRTVRWLGYLGKWSMLDVFVVATTIVIAKISKFMDARAQAGIYVFGASIALSILAGMWLERIVAKSAAKD